ncbi:MAG: hypothetical protein IPJ89_02690 [Candidatus Iainarchaeum archaeon]|uniref:Lon proteolytic domain-containing protein n=1 Tax=Candidatus Iainarchaeum sp. TaxID=3101447 RepID=A0A7T9DKS5_9ARCH|nr:MAG: hypothetical protein IPJ89_02690 [Candidatus Diapherotrites archaeon]
MVVPMRASPLISTLFLILLLASTSFAVLTDTSLRVFAVAPDGKALSAELELHIIPGEGRVWSSVSGPLVGTATQSTEKIAVKISKNYFANADQYDYFFTINSNASVVDGPSAGSAMSLLVVSALQDRRIPTNVGLTGTITTTGEVGPVGGVFEKAKAAHEAGIDLFLIPRGESRQVVKLPEGVKNISLPEYALNEWGMKVVEVKNLDEVLRLAFTSIESIDINAVVEQEPDAYIPPKITTTQAVSVLGGINTQFIKQSREAIVQAQQALSQTLLEDSGLLEVLSTTLSQSERTVNEAELLTENGYYYSAGNFAFLAKVNAYFVHDVAENPELIGEDDTLLMQRVEELQKEIEAEQKILDETVPIEGVEWYIAAQQRLTWAQLGLEKLRSSPRVIVVTEDAQYTQNVERVHDYEFARAWFDSVPQFHAIALQQSTKSLKTQNPFKDYYSQFLTNAEKGIPLMSDGDSEDAQRRLDAAKLDQLQGRHLSAAMNAASSLALVNANLIENDASKDLQAELEKKIQELEKRIDGDASGYAWARLYLDHAKYYLNSAEHYREQNEGTTAANNIVSGYTLALLAENTLEVTSDIRSYYTGLPENQFTPLVSNSLPANGSNGGVIPISIGSDGKGSVTIGNPVAGTNIPVLPILLVLLVVLAVAYLFVARVPKKDYRSMEAPHATMQGDNALQRLDQFEARMFAAKTGMNRIQYQLAKGEISKEKFAMQSKHYQEEIHAARRGLRETQHEMFREAKVKMPRMEVEETHFKQSEKTTKPKRAPTKAKKWASKK